MSFDARETNKNNVIAKLLGENGTSSKLLQFTQDNPGERIGNFNNLRDMAYDIHKNSKDYTVALKDMVAYSEMRDDIENLYLGVDLPEKYFDSKFLFSNNGLSGICGQLDIPAAYIRKCLEENVTEHAAHTLNYWISRAKNSAKEMLLRTTSSRIHGVLSSKYSVFDDHEVFDITEGILGQRNNYEVKNYHLDPEFMKLRIVSRDKVNINGRPLSFGFDINNSRVGRSSLELSVIIFDHICRNGMIMGGGAGLFYNKRHVGISRETFVTEFTDMLDNAPDTVAFIQKAINSAGNEKLNSETIQRYLDKFKAENMSKNISGRVEQMFAEKYDNNLFGFVGAVTEVAQDYNLEVRERMEKFAGTLIYQSGRKIS
ncbi:MAG: hypothetical protein K0R00_232 [Herbinix sp.]|jgi:hypothetical protein|nr:hypothetical protein [Herbinix sp.]